MLSSKIMASLLLCAKQKNGLNVVDSVAG